MGVTTAQAQTTVGRCEMPTFGGSAADACQKGRDLFAYVVPQVGVALSGGNPILGEGGTMGGWGKRAISARLTAVEGYLPRNSVPITAVVGGTPPSSDFGAKRTYVPIPSVDAAVGLFSGVPAGLTNVGGVDALLGVTYLPQASEGSFRLKPSGSSFAFSYGVRVGALQESSVVPGVSISYMRRKLPTENLSYTPGNDTLNVNNMAVTSNTWRLVASKRVAVVGLAAGIGRDEIEGSSGMSGVVNESVGAIPLRSAVTLSDVRTKAKRNTAFLNASFGISLVRVVGEYGWSSAGTIENTVNQFGGRRANEAYRYASLGLTVRF
ncbi:hypothetical protein [Gemmatimonas sp.]|uniref:hypothetical protein n=1 Tax=Gemmatimonas sp. TaxID=1962908 RepID=UPI002EDB6ADE